VTGRVAIITGAASGIGRAIAHMFVDAGAMVGLADIDEIRLTRVVDEIREAGGTAHGVVLDVTDGDSIIAAAAEVRSHLGPIGIVVNNAGVSAGAPIDSDLFENQWQLALDVLLTPHQRMVRACLPDLIECGSGRVINISSTEGLGATPNLAPYTTAKHAVIGLTKSLALELAPHGITVNAICPGPILTSMTGSIPADQRAKFAARRTAVHRYGEPEEVAHMVLNLALPSSSYVTGAAIPVDGGLTIRNG